MGTPDFAVPTLAALIAQGHDIAAVYTQPPRPKGRGLAGSAGLAWRKFILIVWKHQVRAG